jgi:hypothetical protein
MMMVCSVGVDLAPTQSFEEPHERGGTWEERRGELPKGTPLNLLCCALLLPRASLYKGVGEAYPSTKSPLETADKGGMGQP